MEKRHKCKLCFRNFTNGRALGGHMRSHMMKFYDEAKNRRPENHFRPINSFSSTSLSQTSFSSSSSSEEIETEPCKTKTDWVEIGSGRVSGHGRLEKRLKLDEQSSSLSSISDTTPEEDVARCLIMLSRDRWTRAQVEIHDSGSGGGDGNVESSGVGKANKGKSRGGYKCEECGRMFKSYQALGGHRASHRKIRVETPENRKSSGRSTEVEKLHQCPFCHRIFPSGQALGGHKRSHFTGQQGRVLGNGDSTSPDKQNSRNGDFLDIDLNLPAPAEEGECSQVAVSAVSDSDLVS
ncbi:Zinc finger protein ZAT9 [Striga hermonthica]|uniref:Zinc finger protein ZAT9 n=1 Tax=Striga hermonthica TaxID=68872 RepID=A0A9N7RSE5_STRHE|nr:Zinc finger protein ZAT9 [Striga hermonthica]